MIGDDIQKGVNRIDEKRKHFQRDDENSRESKGGSKKRRIQLLRRVVLPTQTSTRGWKCPMCFTTLAIRGEPKEVVFCTDCAKVIDTYNAKADMGDGETLKKLHWFVAHVDPTFISSSSDVSILPPSRKPFVLRDPSADVETTIRKAAEALKRAPAVLIVAGAGMSVDSGLPSFRGKKGFYRVGKNNELKMDEVNFHENQNKGVDILKAWRYVVAMMSAFRDKRPHEGYDILLNTLKSKKDYFVFTSNIDGYFKRYVSTSTTFSPLSSSSFFCP